MLPGNNHSIQSNISHLFIIMKYIKKTGGEISPDKDQGRKVLNILHHLKASVYSKGLVTTPDSNLKRETWSEGAEAIRDAQKGTRRHCCRVL